MKKGKPAGSIAARPKQKKRPTAIDLFAGCGGLTSGLKAAGFSVLAAVEIDRDAAASYRANHPEVKLYEKDIRLITPGRLLNAVSTDRRRSIDLIAGCPPCQGFTRLTESKKRRDSRNGLVREFFRFVRLLRPKACMLENVPGLLKTRKGRRFFNELCRGLAAEGYKIRTVWSPIEVSITGAYNCRRQPASAGTGS